MTINDTVRSVGECIVLFKYEDEGIMESYGVDLALLSLSQSSELTSISFEYFAKSLKESSNE